MAIDTSLNGWDGNKKNKDAKKKPKKEKSSFIALKDGEDSQALKKAKKAPPYSERRAVIYVSHLPHGFYEKELRQYLVQFGAVTNLRLGRSKKTGGSKGYAFVEFKYPEVAQIVCDTMNNYLMFDKLVKCQLVPPEKMDRKIFLGKVNPAAPPAMKARREAKKEVNRLREEEAENKRLRKQLKKLEGLKAKLEGAGITTSAMNFSRPMPSTGKTPVMEVDEDEVDITLKTPPHVKKIKSRSNSAASSAMGTPISSKAGTPQVAKMSKAKELMMSKVLEKLSDKQAGTPKSDKKKKQGQSVLEGNRHKGNTNTPNKQKDSPKLTMGSGKKKRKSMI